MKRLGEIVKGALPLIALLVGVVIGLSVVSEDHYKRGFRAGYVKGKVECKGPTRLERAAKWVSE